MRFTISPWDVPLAFGLNIGVLSGTSARVDLEGYADLILDCMNDLLTQPEFQSA